MLTLGFVVHEQEGEYTEEELPTEVVDSIEANLTEEQRHFAAFSARVR